MDDSDPEELTSVTIRLPKRVVEWIDVLRKDQSRTYVIRTILEFKIKEIADLLDSKVSEK